MNFNGVYQILSPIILFWILLILLFNQLFIAVAIIISIITILSIVNNCLFDNQDNFILELGRFLGYSTLVSFLIIVLVILFGSISLFVSYTIFIIPLVLSVHIRLFKYEFRYREFSYNKLVTRTRYHSTRNTITYPKFSNYALYRIEFYLLLLISNMFIVNIAKAQSGLADTFVMEGFNIIFIAILLDTIIHLILSKYTKLLTTNT